MLSGLLEALVTILYHCKQVLWDLVDMLTGSLPAVLNGTVDLLMLVAVLLIDIEGLLEKFIEMLS